MKSSRPRTRGSCEFVERVRWTTLCEQPMRYSERRYAELWAELGQPGHQPREEARRMTTTTNGHRPAASVPPHNLEAEKSVLGAVLLDERHLYALVADEQLRPEHFYREQHGLVFAAMLQLHQRGSRIDQLTVAEALRQDGQLDQVGGEGAVDELAGWVPAAGHAREYGRIVRDNALDASAAAHHL